MATGTEKSGAIRGYFEGKGVVASLEARRSSIWLESWPVGTAWALNARLAVGGWPRPVAEATPLVVRDCKV